MAEKKSSKKFEVINLHELAKVYGQLDQTATIVTPIQPDLGGEVY